MPAAVALLAARALVACPYCFGDPSSDMVRGAKLGVAFLLVVVAGVLVGIGGIARSWAKRARALDEAALTAGESGGALLAGQPGAGRSAVQGQPAGANRPGTMSPAFPSRTSSNA